MKRFATILLALVMILSLAIGASAATITITPPPVPEEAELGEVTYTAYKVFDATISGNNVAYTIDQENPFYNVINTCGYFKLTQVNGTTTYIVEKNDTYTDDTAKTLAGQLNEVSGKVVAGTVTTTGGAQATLELDDGYYLITSTLGDALILDTTMGDTIKTKNEFPTLEKEADKTTADMGDTITYTITVEIPDTATGTIVVHDKMTGLKFVEMTAPASGVTVVADPDDDCAVEFVIDETTVAAGGTVTITYTAIITADVGNNEAYAQDDEYKTVPDEVEVKNYKFDVFKWTAGEDGAKDGLAGAGFVLKNEEGKYYKYTAATDTEPAKVEWVDDINDATEYITAAPDYTVTFVGLANGTYTLVEKTVPAGYNALQDQTVVINNADLTGEAKIQVENKTGTELPSTGGMGTTMFYAIGGILVLAAVVLLVTKKRMTAAE